MTVHYPFLVFSILLLWFPRNWLRHGARVTPKPPRRYNVDKPDRDPYERTVRPLEEAAKPRNWVDWGRAVVGAYCVLMVAFTPPEDTTGVYWPAAAWQGFVLIAATLIQMIRIEKRLSFFAPIFFLQGMTFGVAGWLVGLLSMLGSLALTPVLPGPGAVLFVQGGLALSLGVFFKKAAPVELMVLAGAIWLPVLISVLLQKRLSASFDKRLKVITRESRGEAA